MLTRFDCDFRISNVQHRLPLVNTTFRACPLALLSFGSQLMTEPSQQPAGTNEFELMARYGITRVPTEQFHYNAYRYTNLTDALAQAKRDNSLS